MKSKQYSSFVTRCWRLINLICWLVHTLWRVRWLKNKPLTQRNQELSAISDGFLRVLNVQVKLNNALPVNASMPWLTVANHVSIIDMFVMMKYIPGGFIATKNIRKWPVLGNLIANVGTVFINRNSRQDVAPVSQAIEKALRQHKNVLFFPEAYTSSGMDVLPFKAALFQAAIDAHVPVECVVLRYYDAHKRTDKVSFSGEISLLKSIWQIISIRQIVVEVDFSPLLNSEKTLQFDRYQLKDKAEEFIRAKVLSDSPLRDQIQQSMNQ